MNDQETAIVVGMGEMKVARGASAVLSCLGLGSCIALCAYDSVARVGGMAHIVLPCYDSRRGDPSPKYADTAVPLLLRELCRQGAHLRNLVVKIAGGAQMSQALGVNGLFKTGERNEEATRSAIAREGLTLTAADTGGHHGRTVRMFLDSGRIVLTIVGNQTRDL